MLEIVSILAKTLQSALDCRQDLVLENLALRHQLAVLTRSGDRPRFRPADRLLWIALRWFWDRWRDSLVLVHPATVVRWHREGFRRYWAWKSRRRSGRPRVDPDLVRLIRRMATANPLWGAPRIHGELLKLGIEVSERTVSRYMPKQRKPPSQRYCQLEPTEPILTATGRGSRESEPHISWSLSVIPNQVDSTLRAPAPWSILDQLWSANQGAETVNPRRPKAGDSWTGFARQFGIRY